MPGEGIKRLTGVGDVIRVLFFFNNGLSSPLKGRRAGSAALTPALVTISGHVETAAEGDGRQE